MSSIIYVILGLFITFVAYFLVTWILVSLHSRMSTDKLNLLDTVKISLSLAGAGLISMILGMIAFSSFHIYIFALLVTVTGFGIYFATLKWWWKFNSFDGAVLAATLAIVFNPAWLHLLGII